MRRTSFAGRRLTGLRRRGSDVQPLATPQHFLRRRLAVFGAPPCRPSWRLFSFDLVKPEIWIQMFKLSEVASAAGVEVRTLTGWLDRRIVDVPAFGSGNNRRFSRDDAIRVALIADLTKVGVSISEAAKAAASFCDEAGGDRDAGELYPAGRTVLIVDADSARCVNVEATREQFDSAMAEVYASERTAVVVVVNAIAKRVDAALAGLGKPLPPAAMVYRHGKQMHT